MSNKNVKDWFVATAFIWYITYELGYNWFTVRFFLEKPCLNNIVHNFLSYLHFNFFQESPKRRLYSLWERNRNLKKEVFLGDGNSLHSPHLLVCCSVRCEVKLSVSKPAWLSERFDFNELYCYIESLFRRVYLTTLLILPQFWTF